MIYFRIIKSVLTNYTMLLPTLLSLQLMLSAGISSMGAVQSVLLPSDPHRMSMTTSGEPDDAPMLHRYTAYNHWANQQLADWLGTASEADLDREIESSFTSLKETIFHIWNAEYLWLQTVKGESADHSPAQNFAGSKEELLQGWLAASENFAQYVQTMSAADLQAKRPRSGGERYTVIADMIHHCMNHSTYHRGQLITMGRQAGLQHPPRTDFIYYISLSDE